MKIVGGSMYSGDCPYLHCTRKIRKCRKSGLWNESRTQGTIGIENELTQEEIDQADIILAIDVKISGRERFDGKRIIQVPTEIAVKSPNKLIRKAQEVVAQKGLGEFRWK